jgi:hypothetical protein
VTVRWSNFSKTLGGLARCALLMTPLLLSGCYYPYGYGYYYPYGYYYTDGYYPPYGYYGYRYGAYSYPPPHYGNEPYYGGSTAPQPYYGGSAANSSGQPSALDPNNCGTPDEPKPCYQRYR